VGQGGKKNSGGSPKNGADRDDPAKLWFAADVGGDAKPEVLET